MTGFSHNTVHKAEPTEKSVHRYVLKSHYAFNNSNCYWLLTLTNFLRVYQLSKSNTCMIFTCIKKKKSILRRKLALMDKCLYGSFKHQNLMQIRLFYAQLLSFRGLSNTLISTVKVTSLFDSVFIYLFESLSTQRFIFS